MSSNTISVRDLIKRERLYLGTNIRASLPKKDTGRFIELNPNDCVIDHDYQRTINTKHAMNIASKFDFKNMKIPTGFYDSKHKTTLITDGQHTVTAAAISGVTNITVYVHDLPGNLSKEDALALQSQQFLSINQSNKPVSRFDIYRNKLIQKDPDYLGIQAMCDRADVAPCGRTTKDVPGSMSHISNLELGWFNIGEKASEQALKFLRKFFPDESIDGGLYIGLVRFIKNMSAAVVNGRQDAVWDDTILYKALTKDGKIKMDKIYTELQEESKALGYAATAQVQNWAAGAIRSLYNAYIHDNGLTVTKLGRFV